MTFQTQDRSVDVDRLEDVLDKMGELARKSADGDYLYRGEPECFPQVSSGLYRKYTDIDAEQFDITVVQNEILQEAKRFIRQEISDDELLAQLQHFGYGTNLIDFTTDYHIALFFACDGQPEKAGRVVLLNKSRYILVEPKIPEGRVIAQKSIFVQPSKGFVVQDDTVVIPGELKGPILDYLRKSHGVTTASIYNDLHGFIKHRRVHESAYTAFYAGLAYQNKKQFVEAVEHYSRSIMLNPNASVPYNNRGVAFMRIGKHDHAIRDYEKAIELNPNDPDHYYNRAEIWLRLKDWGNVRSDLSHAQNLGLDIVSVFCREFGDVVTFEEDYDVRLPEDIAIMLTGQS